ncbi:hypothetical protein Tco_0850291 [Tanacetum coccineum]
MKSVNEMSGWKVRPDGRDVRMERTHEWKVRPDEGDVRMEGTPEWKHVGAVKINPTEICLNKLAPSVGPVIQSTKAKNDGSRFLFNFCHVYVARHAFFGIVKRGSCMQSFGMVLSVSFPSELCWVLHWALALYPPFRNTPFIEVRDRIIVSLVVVPSGMIPSIFLFAMVPFVHSPSSV